MKNPNELLEKVQKCMTDPVYDLSQNFSLEKSREYYNKWVEEWNEWHYEWNPAAKVESETFSFEDLKWMACASSQAMIFYDNIKNVEFVKEAEWFITNDGVVVDWYRLKTFSEWLTEWITDALMQAYRTPENAVRKILEKELGKGFYENTEIHLFVEWKIDEETLKRLWTYEKYQPIEGRDVKEDIKEVLKNMWVDIEETTEKEVEVLTLKM